MGGGANRGVGSVKGGDDGRGGRGWTYRVLDLHMLDTGSLSQC